MGQTRLVIVAVVCGLTASGLHAKTRHVDKTLTEAVEAERAGEFDKAYALVQKGLSGKSGDIAYQLEATRIRFETAAYHVHHAQQVRESGKTEEALKELELASSIDPSSSIAAQELRRTRQILQHDTDPKSLTPLQQQKKDENARIDRIQPAPELRALSNQPINLTMTNRPKVLFDTLGRLAGVNVIFDPDYDTQNPVKQQTIELTNATLQQALDYIALVTKSYWKPLSSNTLFVTIDNRQKLTCTNIKLAGVTLYTVQVNTGGDPTSTLLKNCATDLGKFFLLTSADEIVATFNAIGVELTQLFVAN